MLKKFTESDARFLAQFGDGPMAWEPDYITEDEFKTFVGIPLDDTSDDDAIALAITDASRSVDHCVSVRPNGMGMHRQFGVLAAPENRYYTPRWDRGLGRWVIEIDDLMDITGFALAVDLNNDDIHESSITDYIFRPRNALSKGRPYTQVAVKTTSNVQPTDFRDSARALGLWGWTTTPVAVKEATALQAHRIFKRRKAPFGVTGSPQTNNLETRLLDKVDPDVAMSLKSYVRLGWTV